MKLPIKQIQKDFILTRLSNLIDFYISKKDDKLKKEIKKIKKLKEKLLTSKAPIIDFSVHEYTVIAALAKSSAEVIQNQVIPEYVQKDLASPGKYKEYLKKVNILKHEMVDLVEIISGGVLSELDEKDGDKK